MVCMHCRLDSAADDEIEYCIDKDFTKGFGKEPFHDEEGNTGFKKQWVTDEVKQRMVRIAVLNLPTK